MMDPMLAAGRKQEGVTRGVAFLIDTGTGRVEVDANNRLMISAFFKERLAECLSEEMLTAVSLIYND